MASPLVKTLIPTLPIFTRLISKPVKTSENVAVFGGLRTHGVRRLAPEESRINRRRNHNYPALPSILTKTGQCSLDASIQALWIDLLHQHEPLDRRVLHRRPPYGPRIVHQNVEFAVDLDRLLYQLVDGLDIACVDWQCDCISACFPDLAFDRVDGGLRRVWVRGEGLRLCGVGRGFRRNDNCVIEMLVSGMKGGGEGRSIYGSKPKWELTCVSLLCEIDGDLATDSSRGTNHQCNRLSRRCHFSRLCGF